MFTSVARNGRRASVSFTNIHLFSMLRNSSSLTGVQHLSRYRLPKLLTPASYLRQALTSRYLSVSAASDGGTGSISVTAESEPTKNENFGSFSTDMSSRRSFRKTSQYIQDLRHQEEDDQGEKAKGQMKPTRRFGRRNTPYWYFLQCKKLIKQNKLQEALDMFKRDMIQGERLQPEEFNYSVLIGGCGRAGQLKKAFKLYNDMKKRGLEATDATYTALFNACAEAPSKEAGLQQALKLELELRRKSYPLSTITYHALLKTHAITNHLQACIDTLREMLQNGHSVTQETFHYLLMCCVKDKATGYRLALQIWFQMLKSGIVPDSKNYNLLLRTARDCGIGDPSLASAVLLRPVQKDKRKNTSRSGLKDVIDIDLLERQLLVQPVPLSDGQHCSRDSEDKSHTRQDSNSLVPVRQTVSIPFDQAEGVVALNLLDLFEGKRSSVISLGTMDGPSDRLALIGGVKGFLEKMKDNGLSPDLRTLTLLADTMESSYQSLQLLLSAAKQHNVKLDVTFFNTVIRRAAKAGDTEGAKAVLSVMRQRNVSMDVRTFGCLALSCERQEEGLQLLKDMEDAGLKPNRQVFSALIGRATKRLDYAYLKRILQDMRSLEVWPNEVIIKQLEFASQYPPNYDQYKSRNNYLVQIDGFRGYYQQWLRDMPAQSPEDEQAALQSETDSARLKTEAADGLTESQSNQRAAARRYNVRHTKISSLGGSN